jgi:hypothetical protein
MRYIKQLPYNHIDRLLINPLDHARETDSKTDDNGGDSLPTFCPYREFGGAGHHT